jgi:hypothetical protein
MAEPTNPPPGPVPDGGPISADPARIEPEHHHFLAWAEQVPHEMLTRARARLKKSYAQLENRYGTGYARAILGAGLVGLPIPIPFSTAITAAPVVAAAELHRALSPEGALAGVRASVQLTVEQVETLGKHFLGEVVREFSGLFESPEPPAPAV